MINPVAIGKLNPLRINSYPCLEENNTLKRNKNNGISNESQKYLNERFSFSTKDRM
jgi:hypothetical protein